MEEAMWAMQLSALQLFEEVDPVIYWTEPEAWYVICEYMPRFWREVFLLITERHLCPCIVVLYYLRVVYRDIT